jgi:hypothetical protein
VNGLGILAANPLVLKIIAVASRFFIATCKLYALAVMPAAPVAVAPMSEILFIKKKSQDGRDNHPRENGKEKARKEKPEFMLRAEFLCGKCGFIR